MDKKVLVYQAYGQQEVIEQTIFSIVTLLSALNENDILEIAVYTDQKKAFEEFFGSHPRLRTVDLTTAMIKKWKGSHNYNHRLKVELMIDAGGTYKGPLFYCDADTYFKNSPMPVFRKVNERTSIMHKAETALDLGKDPISKKIVSMINKHHFQIRNELVGIGPSTVMWNAGVIGLCQTNKYLLEYILELTDKSYELLKKHVMEQLAFSFYLQTHSELTPAEHVIHHYWNQKTAYQKAIKSFLAANPNVEKALENYPKFVLPPPPKANTQKSIIRKVLRRP